MFVQVGKELEIHTQLDILWYTNHLRKFTIIEINHLNLDRFITYNI